jgi:hypothetical protein
MKEVLIMLLMITSLIACKNQRVVNSKKYYIIYGENDVIIGYKIYEVKFVKQEANNLYQNKTVQVLDKHFKHTQTTIYNEILHKNVSLLRRRTINKKSIYKPYLNLSDSCTTWAYDSDFGKLMSYQVCYVGKDITKKKYKFIKTLAQGTSHPVEIDLLYDEYFNLIQEKHKRGYGYYYKVTRLEKRIPSALLEFGSI